MRQNATCFCLHCFNPDLFFHPQNLCVTPIGTKKCKRLHILLQHDGIFVGKTVVSCIRNAEKRKRLSSDCAKFGITLRRCRLIDAPIIFWHIAAAPKDRFCRKTAERCATWRRRACAPSGVICLLDKQLYIVFCSFQSRPLNTCLYLCRRGGLLMLSATIFNCCPCHSLLSTLICIFVGKRRGMLTLQTVIYCCCFCQCSPCRDLAKSFFCCDKRCAYVAAKYSLFCPCRSLRHNLLMKHSAGCASRLVGGATG